MKEETMNTLALCGSLKKSSSNLTLLKTMKELAPTDVAITIFDDLAKISGFNPDHLDAELPGPILKFKRALNTADAVVIACPEYGHSLPGVLKNAIDWTIGSGELNRKRVAITAAVRDKGRGLKGLGALHQTLSAVDAIIVFADTIKVDDDVEGQLKSVFEALKQT